MAKLSGKTYWITGASSGIGEAVARRLARYPCKIAITARRRDRLDALAQELRTEKNQIEVYTGDVTDRDRMLEIASEVEKSLGPVDMLIASAGDYKPMDAKEFDSSYYAHLMNVNYAGTLHCTNAVLPRMIERGEGRLVIVSSIVGYRGLPNSASYCATKSALISFFDSLRFDVKKYGISVTLVNPGFVRTQLTDKNEFPMPFRIEPEEAADKFIAGLKAGKDEITFPWQFTLPMKLMSVLPRPVYNFLIQRFVAQ